MATAKTEKKENKCKIQNCKRPYRAKGYCTVHYKKWRRGEYGSARYKTCKNEGCRKPMKRFGMCAEHGEAWMASRKGTASAAAPAAPPAATAAPAETPPAS
jgi:hypothetical protein